MSLKQNILLDPLDQVRASPMLSKASMFDQERVRMQAILISIDPFLRAGQPTVEGAARGDPC